MVFNGTEGPGGFQDLQEASRKNPAQIASKHDFLVLNVDQKTTKHYARPLIVVKISYVSRQVRGLKTRVYCLNFGL